MQNLKITCISEDTIAFRKSLLSSHGQSLLVELDDKRYLFDTSEIYEGLTYNLENLGLKIEDIQALILSHSHLDHSGALFKLVDQLTDQKLFLPPDMRNFHENGYNLRYRTVGKDAAVEKLLTYKNTEIITDGRKLYENIYTTGALESPEKEQSLILTIPGKGLLVLVGCSHPTLPVIIERAKLVTGINDIYGIIGGLHYAKFNDEQLTQAVNYIQFLDPEFIVPSHCTGYNAVKKMQNILVEKVHVSSIGGQFGSGNSVTVVPQLSFDLS